MRLLSRVRSWLSAVTRRSRMEGEMDAELRFHIDAFAEDLVRGGVPREAALRRARIEFCGRTRLRGMPQLARCERPRQPHAGLALRPAHADEGARFYCCRRPHPGPRHRRQHRFVFGGEWRATQPAAILESRPTCGAGRNIAAIL